MSAIFYKKPFDLRRLYAHQPLETCDTGVSISQHIELIIFSRFGEHRFDPGFGCEIWELDFELIVNESMWEEKMAQSIKRSVREQEKRLTGVDAFLKVEDVEKVFPLRRITEIKKKAEVTVTGKLADTGENYVFTTALFLSPLSSE
ncbi:GPW/gp25 family protein [Chitinophaga sp. YIM B06452]|uniref:GPW/gp25 family protein n=1 Tax=Chitinophaga sp. YIM B06452 TaxID=3082158 RepID=UPI0031FE6DBE